MLSDRPGESRQDASRGTYSRGVVNEQSCVAAGWGLPFGSVFLGWFALLLFPPFLGAVPGLAVASAGSLGGMITVMSPRSATQRVLGGIACLSLPVSIAFVAFRPLWMSDLVLAPWAWLLYALSPG